jgi:hypothetical protein
VGSFILSTEDGERTRIMFFARLAELKNYPKLEELIDGTEITGTSFNQLLKTLPEDIQSHLK